MHNDIASLKRQLTQLKELLDAGALTPEHYEESKTALEKRVLDIVLAGTPTHMPQEATAGGSKPSRRLLAGLAFIVLVIAGAGYGWKGSLALSGIGAGIGNTTSAAAQSSTPEGSPHATDYEQIAAMTERLAARLKEEPKNAEGWAMLARSYSVLGRHADALQAYKQAVGLRQDDANLLADYADSLAVSNHNSLNGEPMKWVERTLKLDPRNLKALSLAGTHAFERKDYAAAVKFWEKVVQAGPADDKLVKQAESNLTEARPLAGLPAANKAAVPNDMPPATPALVGASVSGTVSLSPALRQQVSPDETVFVFARAAEGARIPLAIMRKQVRDLPLRFTLDDNMAMSPAGKLSSATRVIVSARISKNGDALPQPGDLTGQSAPVRVGASGLQIDIREQVKP